tara:strand:+ start:227 stop:346 length:120 start_codon:yes stop_codon:yes gene_type:complete
VERLENVSHAGAPVVSFKSKLARAVAISTAVGYMTTKPS